MKKVNTITVVLEDYNDEFEWKDAIQRAIEVLMENRYVMTIREEEKGIVVIDYDYDWNTGLGERAPIWLTSSEEERLVYDEDMEEEED